MIFKGLISIHTLAFLTISFFTSNQAVARDTSLLAGKYKLSLTVLDTDIRYSVNLDLEVSDKGVIKQAGMNYPSFKCRAEKQAVNSENKAFTIQEKIILGQHICEASGYKFVPYAEPNYLSPNKVIFEKVFNLTSGEEIKTVIHTVSYLPNQSSGYLLEKGLSSWQELKQSKDLKLLKNFTINAQNSEYYSEAVGLIYGLTEEQNSIELFEDFIKRYSLKSYKKKAITRLVKLYRDKGTMQSFYKAYQLTKNRQDLKASFFASETASELNEFIKANPEIEQIAGIENLKLEAYRNKNSFDGYLKAFEISSSSEDIKGAFDLVENENQKLLAEKALGLFLTNLNMDSKQCLTGNIKPEVRESYKTLASVCDTPEREERITAICFAVSFGGCDAISSQVLENPLLQTITTRECRKQISRMAVEDPELAKLNSLIGTDIIATGRKIALDSNEIIKYFVGVPFAIGEVVARANAINECIVKARTKCASLYKVCR